MSNAYSTLINWLNDTGITGYFHDLSWSAIALIAICIALPIYIFIKKKPKSEPTIQERIKSFKKDKRHIGHKQLIARKVVGVICSICAAAGCIDFGYRIGWFALAGSICISLLFWLFSTSVRRKWTWYNNLIDAAIIVCFIAFEVAVFTGSYSAQNADKANIAVQSEYDRKTARMEDLKEDKTPMVMGMSRRGVANAQYHNGKISGQIDDLEQSLPTLPKRGETEFFDDVALSLGVPVEMATLYFFFGLSSLFMIGTALNNTKDNSYYSNDSLKAEIKIIEAEFALIENAGTVSDTDADGGNTRTQKTPAPVKEDNFNKNIDSLVVYLRDLPDGKKVVYKDIIRNSAATTDPQAKILRTKLVTLGWLKNQGKNGTVDKYLKLTPGSSSVVKVNFMKRMLGRG